MVGVDGASLNVHEELIYVFDTSVLRSFAVVGRLDLLETRYSGRARMTVEVRAEIALSTGYEPSLNAVLAAPWLLPAISSSAVDEIERMRWMLGGRSHDRRHLGEAGSIQVALESGWILAIDDRDAVRYAAVIGVPTVGTITILQASAIDQQLTPDEAVALLEEMIDVHGRRLPRPAADFFRRSE